MPTTAAEVHVAVGVVVSGRSILVSKRTDKQHLGGLWEFPGGKVEQGEDVRAALVRELKEELDIAVDGFEKLTDVRHDYGDKAVWLDVWWLREFSGEPRGLEGQQWRWQAVETLAELEFPAANKTILEAVLEQFGGQ